MMDLSKVNIVLTCRIGMEKVVASYIQELDSQVKVYPSPYGFLGLVLVASSDPVNLYNTIKKGVPEVEKVYLVEEVCKADLSSLVECAKKFVPKIRKDESFAVSTVRRGQHNFRSIDVNIAVGAIIKQETDARVDLENPDKVLVIQIVQDYAYLSLIDRSEIHRKMRPGKYPMYKLFRRFIVAHEPYLGPPDASYTLGTRIGREVQIFEIDALYVTPIGSVEAQPLFHFLRGLFEGIESRYDVQRRSYGRDVHKVKVYIQELYQFIRAHLGEPMIVFEPEGEPITKVSEELAKFVLDNIRKNKKIILLVGSREGIPVGIFRFANFVLDVAPGIVISTEYALASALIAMSTILHNYLVEEKTLGNDIV